MSAAFPLLGDKNYITYIGPLSHRGANITTHLAEIRYPVQTAPIISVVKFMRPDGLGACNEAIAWLFLRAAGITSPKNAAILNLSEGQAVKILGRKNVPKKLLQNGHILAWAAQKLDFTSIKALFAGSEADAKWLGLLGTVQGAAIAAFDESFLNIDRNTGNILFHSSTSCVPIDHEMSFGMQNWTTSDMQQLPGDGDSLRTLKLAHAGGRLDESVFNQICSRMVFHADKHAAALSACSALIHDLLLRIFHGEAEEVTRRVLSFVTARTAHDWMQKRVGVMC